MAHDRSENDPVLTNMLAKVAAWQAAVDSYRAAKALEQGGQSDSIGGPVSRGTIELPVNAFRGMTMNEAIKLFLKSVQRKQTTAEIAEGLKNGGLVSTAKDIAPTLRNALSKLRADGTLLRFPDGWDLSEAHSAMIRHRVTREQSKPQKNRGKKTGAAKAKGGDAAKRKAHAPKQQSDQPTLDARAEIFLRSRLSESFTAKQIADALGLPDTSKLILSLSRMVRYKKAVKSADGRYSIEHQA